MSALVQLRMQRPNPRPHAAIEDPEDVASVRRLHCRRYNECLGVAEAANWPGFACTACAAYVPMNPEQEESDRLALLRLFSQSGLCVFNEAATRAVQLQEEG